MPQCKTIYIYGVTPCYIKQVTFSFPWSHNTNLHGFSDVFRGYRKRPVVWNGLIKLRIISLPNWSDFVATEALYHGRCRDSFSARLRSHSVLVRDLSSKTEGFWFETGWSLCRVELSAVITSLISRCLWSGWTW